MSIVKNEEEQKERDEITEFQSHNNTEYDPYVESVKLPEHVEALEDERKKHTQNITSNKQQQTLTVKNKKTLSLEEKLLIGVNEAELHKLGLKPCEGYVCKDYFSYSDQERVFILSKTPGKDEYKLVMSVQKLKEQ